MSGDAGVLPSDVIASAFEIRRGLPPPSGQSVRVNDWLVSQMVNVSFLPLVSCILQSESIKKFQIPLSNLLPLLPQGKNYVLCVSMLMCTICIRPLGGYKWVRLVQYKSNALFLNKSFWNNFPLLPRESETWQSIPRVTLVEVGVG